MGEVALGGSPTVKRVIDRLVEELHDRHEATYDMMRRLDRNGDGRLDREELRTLVRRLCYAAERCSRSVGCRERATRDGRAAERERDGLCDACVRPQPQRQGGLPGVLRAACSAPTCTRCSAAACGRTCAAQPEAAGSGRARRW